MPTEVKHSSAWRTLNGIEVKHSGAWRDVKTVEVRHGGVWREVYSSGPTVSPATNGDINVRLNNPCYAGIQFNSNGTEYEYTNTGALTSLGAWLDSGLNSEVWVQMVLSSGSWNSLNAGTTRLQLSTTRSWRVVRSSVGSQSATATFNFYDAASGGNLLATTGLITFRADYENFA